MNYRSNTYALFILLLLSTSALAQTINRAEYFIDNDPGHGNGTAVAVPTPAATVNFNFTINTNSLSTGFHLLGFRLRQNDGRWGHPNHTLFFIAPVMPSATNLTKAEYFFDTDPGFGNGTPFTFTLGSTVTIPALNVNIGSLSPGFHSINFRFRDDRGRWTHASAHSFYVIPPVTADLATNITRIEYFFNTDLGAGNNTSIPIAAGNPQSNTFPITLPGTLTPGFHQIGFRYRDDKNRWSQAESRTFYVLPPVASNNRQIVAAEYFVDSPQGTGTRKAIAGIVPGVTLDQLIALDMTGVPNGNHTLSVRIKDSNGFWSYLVTENFTISACIPPTPPAAPNVSRCNEGPVTLTASGASGAQVYRWYDDPILNNLLFTGSSFTTPSLSASKNYYVSIFDSGTNCESTRVTVAATVTTIAKPIINPSGSLSICEGSSIFLSAPAGFSSYVWSTGQTTQQILVATTGNYSVQSGNGTCLSESSDAVTVSVIPSPTKPVITASGNTTICGTGSVTLSGPVGFEYQWSTGATTQTITVNQTGVFFLIVKTTGANCPSFPSDPVVVSVLTPPCGAGSTNKPPVINDKPFAAQIEGRVEVDLTNVVSDPDNNLDFSTLQVINNQTARGVAASIDASYFLQINYAGNPFTGADRITLSVCDLAGACGQQVIDIEVVGEVIVFNGITPDGDGLNDFMEIKYVDVVDGASKNKVTVFNRWGDAVWEVEDYDNLTRVFSGQTNSGKDLPSGTYFYKIDFPQGKPKTGFITLKR